MQVHLGYLTDWSIIELSRNREVKYKSATEPMDIGVNVDLGWQCVVKPQKFIKP